MLTSSNSVVLVDAVLGAGAYTHDLVLSDAERKQRETRRLKALENIRMAQVDLFCDHNHHALKQIHAAQSDLEGSGIDNYTSEALARAAWLALHNQYAEANEVLEAARAGIIYQS
ncbi:MAG: hypothetical protein AB9M60_02895 [Leptothrix sp. (in: b-proteobacteria)]